MFDDIIESGKAKKADSKSSAKVDTKFLLDYAKKMGLNDDFVNQILVPVASLLDKHGGNIAESDNGIVKAASGLIGMAEDFGPLFQGALSYFSGVRKSLDDADRALLEASQKSMSVDEISRLMDDNEFAFDGGAPEEQQYHSPQPQERRATIMDQKGPVDYFELMGVDKEQVTAMGGNADDYYAKQLRDRANVQGAHQIDYSLPPTVQPVEELAEQGGYNQEDVNKADYNTQMQQGVPDQGGHIDYTDSNQVESLDTSNDAIMAALVGEQRQIRQQIDSSQATHVDMNDYDTNDLANMIRGQAKAQQGQQSSSDDDAFRRSAMGRKQRIAAGQEMLNTFTSHEDVVAAQQAEARGRQAAARERQKMSQQHGMNVESLGINFEAAQEKVTPHQANDLAAFANQFAASQGAEAAKNRVKPSNTANPFAIDPEFVRLQKEETARLKAGTKAPATTDNTAPEYDVTQDQEVIIPPPQPEEFDPAALWNNETPQPSDVGVGGQFVGSMSPKKKRED